MRRIAMMAAAAAFFGGGAVASAADLGSYKDSPAYAPAPIWTGFYVGGHAGGLWTGDSSNSADKEHCYKDWKNGYFSGPWWNPKWNPGYHKPEQCKTYKNTDQVKFESDKDDDVAFLGGLHLGYNYQVGSTVLGIEGDLSFADQVDYIATLRGRLGYARDNFLIYATAGVAFAGFDNSVDFKIGNDKFSYGDDDDRQIGFVVGGGVEYKIRPNLSLGVEGLYYAFGDDEKSFSKTYGYGNCKCDIHKKTYDISGEDDLDMWTVRARLTYHFTDEAAEAPLK
jgi:outer membrane immunogenic protein